MANSRRLRVLLILPYFPLPAVDGGKVRMLNTAIGLARRHDVHLGVLYSPEAANTTSITHLTKEGLTVHISPASFKRGFSGLTGHLSSLTTSRSEIEIAFYGPAVRAFFGELLQSGYDIVQFEHLSSASLADLVPSSTATIIVDHNVEYRLRWEIAKAASLSLGRRWHYLVESAKLRFREPRILKAADAIVAMSEADARAIQLLIGGKPVAVIPNGVDTAAFLDWDRRGRGTVALFVGSLGYPPNSDALEFFVDDVMPIILRRLPAFRLVVVGRAPSDLLLRKMAARNVAVYESVSDVKPFYREAAVFVVPLRIGGGTRLKVLEAMAAGLPVVSTRIGVQGIDVVDETHILLRDTPEGIAHSVVELINNDKMSRQLVVKARELVETKYDWKRIVPLYDDLYRRIMTARRVNGELQERS